jgi:hypothetical protein
VAKVVVDLVRHTLSREEAGVVFDVFAAEGGKAGELRVSKGGLRWWSRNERGDAHFISWEDFDLVMRRRPRH